MSIVVSDTSPIRALNHLGLLDVLSQLFGRVLLPPAVLDELTRSPRFGAVDLSQQEFIEVREPRDTARVQQFRENLDLGESEALALALEVDAEALLIDETAGRLFAKGQGVSVIGTLGVLSRAKTRGLVSQVGPLLDRLRTELGFFVSDELRAEFLRSVGE